MQPTLGYPVNSFVTCIQEHSAAKQHAAADRPWLIWNASTSPHTPAEPRTGGPVRREAFTWLSESICGTYMWNAGHVAHPVWTSVPCYSKCSQQGEAETV